MNDMLEDTQTDIETPKETPHLSDILVTQIILCIAILLGMFILNLVKPTICKYMVDSFKHFTSTDFSKSIKDVLVWLYDRV